MVYVSVTDLLQLPEFITHLHTIVSPYYEEGIEISQQSSREVKELIRELEKNNLRRLIDRAIDEQDEDAFHLLTEKWNALYT